MRRTFSNEVNAQFAEEIINPNDLLDDTVAWIKDNLEPDDVFDEDDLIKWAEANGYEPKI